MTFRINPDIIGDMNYVASHDIYDLPATRHDAYKLWLHQSMAIEKASHVDYYALFFEMGCGKTATALRIVADKQYYNGWKEGEPLPLKTLVLAPKSVTLQWRDEIVKWVGVELDTIRVVYGKSTFLKVFNEARENQGIRFISLNYEKLLNKDCLRAIMAWSPEVVIFDESHLLKNHSAKRSKLAHLLGEKAKYRLILSGTPVLKDIGDLFMQYKILDHGVSLGTNFFRFRDQYFFDKNHSWKGAHNYFPDWRPKETAVKEIRNRTDLITSRARKKDCMDLPPLVKTKVVTYLSPEQNKLYADMKKDLVAYISTSSEGAASIAKTAMTKILRLQQIVSGHLTLDDGGVHKIRSVPRLETLREVLEAIPQDEKAIIWCSFIADYERVAELLTEMKEDYVLYTGGTTDFDKNKAVEAIQSSRLTRFMIANQKCAGLGLNLTRASYSIYYSKGYSLADDAQSEARNYRGGSEIHAKVTRVDLVVPGTTDELINEALARKLDLADQLMQNIRQALLDI